jgi:hypothetical protein
MTHLKIVVCGCACLPGAVTERSRHNHRPIADPAGTVVPNASVEVRNVKAGAVNRGWASVTPFTNDGHP